MPRLNRLLAAALAAWVAGPLGAGAASLPPGVTIGGPVDTNTVTATGGTAAITNGNRGAYHLSVEDFGAKGDCSTDDTAAFNSYSAYLRAQSGYLGYAREFSLGHGRCYILAGSVNLTALSGLIFDGHNSTIVGRVVGYPVLDAVQSPQAVFQNFNLVGQGSPRIGIQIGRALNGLSGAQSNAFHNVFVDGTFTLASIYNRASESTLYDNVFATNRLNSSNAYAAILDGDAYWQITSQFASTYNPTNPTVVDALYGTSPNMSFNENTIIGGTFESYYNPAIWMSNFRGLDFENPYVAGYYASLSGPGQGPAAVLYFGANDAPAHLRWKVHSEGGISSDIQFAGVQTSPTLVGFDYENHIDSTFGSALSLGGSATSATVKDIHARVASFYKSGVTLLDTGPAWTLYGNVSVPLANWNGTVNGLLDTGTGPTFSGALGNVTAGTLTASALNASSVGNPGGVAVVSVVTPTGGTSLWPGYQLSGALPLITLTSNNGQGGGATAVLQNLVMNSPPTISGGVGCSVGDTFNITDTQSGGNLVGGGNLILTASAISSGAVTSTGVGQSSGNAYSWLKPMSASTILAAKSSTCTTLPTLVLSSGVPNATWAITNSSGSLKSGVSSTAGSGYTATPNYTFTPAPQSPVAGGANLTVSLSASLTVGAGGAQIAFGSAGITAGTTGSSGLPFKSAGALIDGSGVRTALTASGYTVPANTSLVRFTQNAAVTATITLPTALADGQPIQFVNQGTGGTSGAITATFSPAVQGFANGGTIPANSGFRIRWDATAAAWQREQ